MCMGCHKAIVVITGSAHCFLDYDYIYIILYIYYIIYIYIFIYIFINSIICQLLSDVSVSFETLIDIKQDNYRLFFKQQTEGECENKINKIMYYPIIYIYIYIYIYILYIHVHVYMYIYI